MSLFASFFAAIRRLTATVHSLADVGDAIHAELESRVAPSDPARLAAPVDPGADTVDLPARRNGTAKARVK